MIIIKAPFRITLGGGGTDLPNWYTRNGSFLLSAAIDKYIYLTGCFRNIDKKIWLSYSKLEIKDNINRIEHEIFREVLLKFKTKIKSGLEIHSISDLPGMSGMGSSGVFTVAVCSLLNELYQQGFSRRKIAEMACHVEMIDLKRSSGKQDQYISTFGGISKMNISKSGEVSIEKLGLDSKSIKKLNENLLIYYTGTARNSENILKNQNINLKKSTSLCDSYMRKIQEIGFESEKLLLQGKVDSFGEILNEHWNIKRKFDCNMSSDYLDAIYDDALKYGSLGGKIIGAGGGGFYMFYVPKDRHTVFREKISKYNLKELNWCFDFNGVSKIKIN